eukprot:2071553-Prymnesium_polylepis.1
MRTNVAREVTPTRILHGVSQRVSQIREGFAKVLHQGCEDSRRFETDSQKFSTGFAQVRNGLA